MIYLLLVQGSSYPNLMLHFLYLGNHTHDDPVSYNLVLASVIFSVLTFLFCIVNLSTCWYKKAVDEDPAVAETLKAGKGREGREETVINTIITE